MAKDSLKAVLDTEISIRDELAAEECRAKAWLDAQRQEMEKEMREEEGRLTSLVEEELESCRRSTDSKATEIIHRAEKLAASLDRLDEQKVLDLLNRHLPGILPGGGP